MFTGAAGYLLSVFLCVERNTLKGQSRSYEPYNSSPDSHLDFGRRSLESNA